MSSFETGYTEFKIGDRVICKSTSSGQFTKGKEYVVAYLNDYSVGVEKDDTGNKNGWGYEFFTLAPPIEYSCIRVVPPSKPKREIVEGMITLHDGATIKVMKEGADDDVKLLIQECPFFTAKALREAAALFTTLAEVLEENSNA